MLKGYINITVSSLKMITAIIYQPHCQKSQCVCVYVCVRVPSQSVRVLNLPGEFAWNPNSPTGPNLVVRVRVKNCLGLPKFELRHNKNNGFPFVPEARKVAWLNCLGTPEPPWMNRRLEVKSSSVCSVELGLSGQTVTGGPATVVAVACRLAVICLSRSYIVVYI